MSFTAFALSVAAVWLAIGIIVSIGMGDRVDRFTLAAVVDYDAVSGGPAARRAQAEGELAHAAEALSGVPSERVILVGAPADALASASREGGFDLLVVGSRGRGASRTLLGSVASHLARGAGIPVLLCDAPDVRGSKHSAGRDDGSTAR